MSQITMKELLEAGVHFGHQTKRWNPKMAKYIFGERNGIYIIDLQKTLKKFREAHLFTRNLAAEGRRSSCLMPESAFSSLPRSRSSPSTSFLGSRSNSPVSRISSSRLRWLIDFRMVAKLVMVPPSHRWLT